MEKFLVVKIYNFEIVCWCVTNCTISMKYRPVFEMHTRGLGVTMTAKP